MNHRSFFTAIAILFALAGGALAEQVPYPVNQDGAPASLFAPSDFVLASSKRGIADSGFATIPCNKGGTGLTGGTNGGVLAFTSACGLASSSLLTQHALVLGGGAGATPYALGSLGTSHGLLHGNASGDPTWGFVDAATEITGTIPTTSCPTPTLSSVGCVFAPANPPVTHQYIYGYNGSAWLSSQPGFSDLSGSLGCSQLPALTGDATSSAGSCATTLSKIAGVTASRIVAVDGSNVPTGSFASSVLLNSLTDETGTGSAVFANAPSLTGTGTFVNLTGSGILKLVGANLSLDDAAGVNRGLVSKTAGVLRWQIKFADSGAESGSNAGSDLRINNYDDSGAAIGTPFILKRSTGLLTLANGATINGGLTLGTVLTVPNGGIGAVTLASNGVLYGQGTSAIAALAVNATATHKYLQQFSSGAPAWAQIAAGDLTGLAAIAISGSATDLITGTVPAARLPNPTASTLGGIESYASVSHQWINAISTLGVPSSTQPGFSDISGTLASSQCPAGTSGAIGCLFAPSTPPVSHQFIYSYNGTAWLAAQPDFSDLSGTLAAAQFGPLTGDVTTSGYAATLASIQGTTITGTTGNGKVALADNPVFTTAVGITGSLSVSSQIVGGSVSSGGPVTSGYTVSPQYAINPISVVDRQYAIKTNGNLRWALGTDGGAESGSNAGSDGYIARYNDAGTLLDKPLTMVRSTGAFTIADGLTVTGSFGSCINQFYRSVTASLARTCASVSLTADVTGILPGANGGTANGFMAFSGPTTSLKTFTLPNASANVLTDNALVTVAQGGIGIGTLASNGVLYGNGTGAVQALAVNATATHKYLQQFSSGAPAWAQVAFSELSGSITPAQCPAGTISAIGCLFAPASPPVTHQFLTTYNGTAWVSAQPDASDLTGLAAIATSGSASDLGTGTIPNARIVALPNANLANSSVTISGHSLSLGGSLSLASGDISGLGTAATQNTGTSGATLPFLNGSNTFGGTDHFSSSLYADADTYVTNAITPPTIVANMNDYAPTGFASATVLRVSANSGPFIITGLAGGAAGRKIVIEAVGSNAFAIGEQNAGSSAANRFELGSSADLLVYPGSTVEFWYDTATSRWQRMGGSALQTAGVFPGAIFSGNCALSHNFVLGYNVSGTAVCAQPSFSDLASTPTTLAGYSITDALKTTNNLSDVSSPVTATNNLGHWHKTLSAQVDKTANNSSAAVTDLTITGVAGKTYKYVVVLKMTLDATNGLRIRMGGSSTATSSGNVVSILCLATKVYDATTSITAWASTNVTETTCTAVLVEIKGTVVVNAGGTITPQWAQMNTTNPTGISSILLDGTYADYDQIN